IQDNCELTYSDDSVHYFNDTILCFSPPFFHGPEDVRLGFVIMTTVTDQTTTLVHASDVQGPVTKDATEYIINQKPDIVIMDGPPTLFLGWRFSKKNLKDATDNLIRIIKQTNCDIILDHHLLRDVHYRNRFAEPYKRYPNKIKSFAEYQGKENLMLEAQRKTIWQQEHK
ncbi:MAG: MBL fold metallo-hydrolase, partial [Candidatus Thermoplasmatota archaeon]|nr:MBL fold metallo-hydrolase [Candidatus Thermoplasmatota archaeon]